MTRYPVPQGTSTSTRFAATGGRRPDASMTLLNEVMERPLDLGYAAASDARRRGVATPQTPVRRSVTFLLAVLLGVVAVWAARELRAPVEFENASDVLVEEIRGRTAIGDRLAEQNEELRQEITELQAEAMGEDAEEFLADSARLGLWAGATAVQGTGIVITVEDSVQARNQEPGAEDGRVRDSDLQFVVNGLWAAGAEAIAVNGHRLTGHTAIRTAGDAVLVDLQPLVSPYRIEVIGDPDDLRTEFARTQASAMLNQLAARHSIASSIETADKLVLPAGTAGQPDVVTESS
ncbi:DUF881 domain-containing protein [Ruania halotolerans]|uniref:DUF881 domain-containing protein n=1 Tax=Ruania halotolerans TaxID=2897773 RepID=UPI001E617C7C|nr:DUF881 domain-containing protein [Ruania halotolerans]UFU08235.1 DUF881 domain-containing protein [Ruania halotolerans]